MTTRLICLVSVFVLSACEPVWRIPGGRLYGEVVIEPVSDWGFTAGVTTVALETRPGFPHSVTVVCFTHEGRLYIPSFNVSTKKWPEYVRQNRNVRLKIASKIYPGYVERVDSGERDEILVSFAAKFRPGAEAPGSDQIPDFAFYRFEYGARPG